VIRPGEAVEVYLCREVVDMRRGISGLSALVEKSLGFDPFAKRLLVFCGRRRNHVTFYGLPLHPRQAQRVGILQDREVTRATIDDVPYAYLDGLAVKGGGRNLPGCGG
jgi:hypothetical protein